MTLGAFPQGCPKVPLPNCSMESSPSHKLPLITQNFYPHKGKEPIVVLVRLVGKLIVELDFSLFVVQNEWFYFCKFLIILRI
jgi:hypothetical protein